MVELVPNSSVFAYPATLNKVDRLKKKTTRICRALLRMLINPGRLMNMKFLKEVNQIICKAVVGKSYVRNGTFFYSKTTKRYITPSHSFSMIMVSPVTL